MKKSVESCAITRETTSYRTSPVEPSELGKYYVFRAGIVDALNKQVTATCVWLYNCSISVTYYLIQT